MRELLVATKNQGKMREIRELLKEFDVKVTSLADYPNCPDIVEDGKTFKANAIKKAAIIGKYTGKLTLGEDSGLQVKALGNKPGIYSARFSGEGATDEKNNSRLLSELRKVPTLKRQARYRCFAALCDGKKLIGVVDGSCGGVIIDKRKGANGFGYDPLFLIPRYKKTFGELDPLIKAKISHRARALRKLKAMLVKYLR
ncbi:MAG: XTP/dITP diphosphatase [Candidatus Omnitrophica bacterium]|nr:XTP/dITP diphosphatase [Candidatus Omnitrophota bacterium]